MSECGRRAGELANMVNDELTIFANSPFVIHHYSSRISDTLVPAGTIGNTFSSFSTNTSNK